MSKLRLVKKKAKSRRTKPKEVAQRKAAHLSILEAVAKLHGLPAQTQYESGVVDALSIVEKMAEHGVPPGSRRQAALRETVAKIKDYLATIGAWGA